MDDTDMVVPEHTAVYQHKAFTISIFRLIGDCLQISFSCRCVEYAEIDLGRICNGIPCIEVAAAQL